MMMGALRPFLEKRGDGFAVGANNPDTDYQGPTAEIYIEGQWLFVVTDPHEGSVMLNVEALPKLRLALQKMEAAQGIVSREGEDAAAASVSEAN
jgi:hypothetical protein